MIYYQNSWRILEENSCMLFTGDIIDWRYFAWRYFAGDILLAIFLPYTVNMYCIKFVYLPNIKFNPVLPSQICLRQISKFFYTFCFKIF